MSKLACLEDQAQEICIKVSFGDVSVHVLRSFSL